MGFYPTNKVAETMSIRPAPYPASVLPDRARAAFLAEFGRTQPNGADEPIAFVNSRGSEEAK